MNFALSWQGDRLNKFMSHSVDYFEKKDHWSDFCELICSPVAEWLEINDEAIEAVYEQTAGNPFFTKLLCDEIYRIAVERRDSYIAVGEVEDAVRRALNMVGVTNFQHFWKDGLLTAREGAEDRSITRRKVLLALSDSLDQPESATKEYIIENAKQYHLTAPEVEVELGDFVGRKILICQDGIYRPKVPLFERWMRERGRDEVLTRLIDEDAALASRQRADSHKVKSDEIMQLVERWPHYKGGRITEDTIRNWLHQFIGYEEQRLMFAILEGIHFYSQAEVREKMREAYKMVSKDMAERGVLWSKPERALRRHDLIVSHLDASPGKSGTHYARLFAEENGILMDNVVPRVSIAKEVILKQPCHALIFVDDIIGTGRSASENLISLVNDNPEIFRSRDSNNSTRLLVYIVAICGFGKAQERIEKELRDVGIDVTVRVCDILTDEDKCF